MRKKIKVSLEKNSLKNIKFVGSVSLIAKFLGIVLQLVMVYIISKNYGQNALGLWILIAAINVILQVIDFGFGSGNVNEAAKAHANKSYLSGLIASSLIYTSLFSMAGCVLCFVVINDSFLSIIQSNIDQSLLVDIKTLLPYIFLTLPFIATAQVAYGIQEGDKVSISIIIGQVLFLIYLAIDFFINLGVLMLIRAYYISIFIGYLYVIYKLYAFIGFKVHSYKFFEYTLINRIQKSFPFFIIQMASVFSFGLDMILVATYVGMNSVPEYGITQRIYYMPGIILAGYLNASWPIFANHNIYKRYYEIRSLYKKLLNYSIIFAAVCIFLIGFFIDEIFSLWTNKLISPNYNLVFIFSLWTLLNAIGGVQASYMNGMNILRKQAFLSIIFAFFNILLSFMLIKEIGITGPIISSIICLTVQYTINAILIKSSFKRMS